LLKSDSLDEAEILAVTGLKAHVQAAVRGRWTGSRK